MALCSYSVVYASALIFIMSAFFTFGGAFETACYDPGHFEPPNVADCRTIVNWFDNLSHQSPWRLEPWIFGRHVSTNPPRTFHLPYRWQGQPGLQCTFSMVATGDASDTMYLGDIYGAMSRILRQCMSGERRMAGRSIVINRGNVALEFLMPPSAGRTQLGGQDMEANSTDFTIGNIATA